VDGSPVPPGFSLLSTKTISITGDSILTNYAEVIEVVLLDLTIFNGDFAVQCAGETVNDTGLELLTNDFRS